MGNLGSYHAISSGLPYEAQDAAREAVHTIRILAVLQLIFIFAVYVKVFFFKFI
jgi:hypothetical protein